MEKNQICETKNLNNFSFWSLIENKRKYNRIRIITGTECLFSCKYCFEKTSFFENKNKNTISTNLTDLNFWRNKEKVNSFLKYLFETFQPIRKIEIFGGEPFFGPNLLKTLQLLEQILEMPVEYFKSLDSFPFYLRLQTNQYWVNNDKLREKIFSLVEKIQQKGISQQFNFSIDGKYQDQNVRVCNLIERNSIFYKTIFENVFGRFFMKQKIESNIYQLPLQIKIQNFLWLIFSLFKYYKVFVLKNMDFHDYDKILQKQFDDIFQNSFFCSINDIKITQHQKMKMLYEINNILEHAQFIYFSLCFYFSLAKLIGINLQKQQESLFSENHQLKFVQLKLTEFARESKKQSYLKENFYSVFLSTGDVEYENYQNFVVFPTKKKRVLNINNKSKYLDKALIRKKVQEQIQKQNDLVQIYGNLCQNLSCNFLCEFNIAFLQQNIYSNYLPICAQQILKTFQILKQFLDYGLGQYFFKKQSEIVHPKLKLIQFLEHWGSFEQFYKILNAKIDLDVLRKKQEKQQESLYLFLRAGDDFGANTIQYL